LINAGHDVFLLVKDGGEEKKNELIDGINVIRIINKTGIQSLPFPKNPI